MDSTPIPIKIIIEDFKIPLLNIFEIEYFSIKIINDGI